MNKSYVVLLIAFVVLVATRAPFWSAASAQEPATSVCKMFTMAGAPAYQEFLNDQIAAGRVRFFAPAPGLVCAW